MIQRIAILVLEMILAIALLGLCWAWAHRARASRKRRLRQMEMELRLADASEAFHQEVFRLRLSQRVLRSNGIRQNRRLIPSTKVSSLRYIKGRQDED